METETVRRACAGPFYFYREKQVKSPAHKSPRQRVRGLSMRLTYVMVGGGSPWYVPGAWRPGWRAGGAGSEEAADHAGIAGTQPLQAAQGFLGSTVRCGMVKETVERF